MITKKMPKNAENFYCKQCNFTCSKQSNYNKHLTTAKHNKITNGNDLMPDKCRLIYTSEVLNWDKIY